MTTDQTVPSQESGNDETWQPCRPGEIAGMVQRIRDRRRAASLAKATGAAAMLLAGVAIWQFSGLHEAPSAADMTCGEVMESLDDYRAGRVDEEKARRIEAHLADCPQCSERFQESDPEASRSRPGDRLISSRPRFGNTLAALDP